MEGYKREGNWEDHNFSYRSIPTGECEILDHGQVVAKVDNSREAKEWIDEEFIYFKQKENKDTEA